ncbi:MAG: rod shape-determining protein MreC [bacterium]|nr:rod shape-determining protein MreC [bacterium]
MKYYQLAIIFLLFLILLMGRFLIAPQAIFYSSLESGLEAVEWPKARIYSTYPFSNKAELLINVGVNDGAVESMSVVVEEFLLGKVTRVFENYSVVKTIFDSSWEISVRVGPQEVDALLEGGPMPRLTMVAKDGEFAVGQAVYSANRDFEYGSIIGYVKAITDNSAAVFREAELVMPYDFNDLRVVTLVR